MSAHDYQTRDRLIHQAHALLEQYGIDWSPSRVASLVKKYLAGSQTKTLESVIAELAMRRPASTGADDSVRMMVPERYSGRKHRGSKQRRDGSA